MNTQTHLMKTPTLLIAAAAILTTAPLAAQGLYYGTFYPKSAKVSTLTTNRNGFGSTAYHNAARAGSSSTSASCFVNLQHHVNDIIGLTLVSNYNLSAALVPDSLSLNAFLARRHFNYMLNTDVGIGQTTRSYGSQFHSISGMMIPPGTYGLGVRANIWSSYSTSSMNPLTGHEVELKYIHAYQPGQNPWRHSGAYHSEAWVRDSLLSFSLSQPQLPSGKGLVRRWTLGNFWPATDSRGNVRNRYLITGNANLNAQGSAIRFIAVSDVNAFLAGRSVTTHATLPVGWMSQELRLAPGRTYALVVQDGRSATGYGRYSSTGAQVRIHIARYF